MLLIDKPKGMTSHDIVDAVRHATGEKRVGHAGTLDPNATGLLIVGVGREETKKLSEIAKNTRKTYVADIFLGEERDTDDIEGKITSKNEYKTPSKTEVSVVVKSFLGEQEQIPPSFSAIKLNGRKAYQVARRGEEIKLKSRKIIVYKAQVLEYKYPILRVEFEVSSGTYIRSLARDIGRKLGTYGYLNELRRTQVGEFSVNRAILLQELQQRQK